MSCLWKQYCFPFKFEKKISPYTYSVYWIANVIANLHITEKCTYLGWQKLALAIEFSQNKLVFKV